MTNRLTNLQCGADPVHSGTLPAATRLARLSLLVISAALAATQPAHAATSRTWPNVLLVITDDQGFGDIRSHGNPYIQTPAQDRLAAEGIRFDRFFVSPVCAPTRASLLTGRWHLRTGVHGVTRARETMRSDELTIAEVFRRSGYATAMFGKWHNGGHYPQDPIGQGFEEFYGFCAGHWNNYFDSFVQHNNRWERFNGFLIDRLTDRALAFIDSHRATPWFCYVSYNTPHSPWQVPQEYWQRYADREDLPDDRARCAYAMVENIDDNLARLLQRLRDSGLERETIVVFLTDNGANSDRFNAGMRGRKGSMHEGGSRVPLFIRWPGTLPAGKTVRPIAAHVDLLPTLAELTGAKLPASLQLDGRSLVPLCRPGDASWAARMLYTHWGNGPRTGLPRNDRGAVRTDQWRAVLYGGRWELFDMVRDPGQKRDVASQHPLVTRRMQDAFETWFTDVCRSGFDPIPTEIGHPQSMHVSLPGHEATLRPARGQGIRYQGAAGWANDWITGWTNPNAWAEWPIKVVRPGNYHIALQYAAPRESLGKRFIVQVGDASLPGIVTRVYDPPPIPSPDRVGRKEVYERLWARLDLGSIELPAGTTVLQLRPGDADSGPNFDVKSIEIELP